MLLSDYIKIYLKDEKAKVVSHLTKKDINVAGTVTKDGVTKKAYMRSQLVKAGDHPVVQNIGKAVEGFTSDLNKHFENYDMSSPIEKKEEFFNKISTKMNDAVNAINVQANQRPDHADGIREKAQLALDTYLEGVFDIMNKDKSLNSINPTKNLKKDDMLYETFLTNKNLTEQPFKNYSSAKTAYQFVASAPEHIMKKGVADKNVVDISDTPIGNALTHLKKLKNHSHNVDNFNKVVTDALDKATNHGKDLSLLEKLQYGKDIKQMNTVFDYHVSNDHTQGLLGKTFKGERFENVGNQYWNSPVNTVANSQNPKKMQQFLEDSGRQTINLRGEYNINRLIENWTVNSDLPTSRLLKRGMEGVTGIKNIDKTMYIGNNEDVPIFKQGGLSKDKLPDELASTMSKMYNTTQKYLENNPDHFSNATKVGELTEKGIISRGMDLAGTGNVVAVSGGSASTSSKLDTAYSFCGLNKYADNKRVQISDIQKMFSDNGNSFQLSPSQQKYVKDAYIAPNFDGKSENMSIVMNYDANKLAQDKRIFAILDGGGLDELKKTFPKLNAKYLESEAIAIF